MEARADFNKAIEANLERAVEVVKGLPELEKVFMVGQISGMLASRNMAAQKDETQQKNAG